MEAIKLNATLEERESKNGNKYSVIVVKLTDNYEKLVFLEKAEEELIKINSGKPSFMK